MIVLEGTFLLPSSRVPGGVVLDEIDTCIKSLTSPYSASLIDPGEGTSTSFVRGCVAIGLEN